MDENKPDNATQGEPKAERARRSRVLKGAHAAFNEEHSAIPCTIRDISETGAKLQFELGWLVPQHFTLFVDIDGYKVECEMVRHEEGIYGVRFVGPKVPTELGHRQNVQYYDPDDARTASAVTNRPSSALPSSAPAFGARKPVRRQFGRLGKD